MPCYRPLAAWQLVTGEVVFSPQGKGSPRPDRGIRRELSLPCGQCVGCRLERSRQWAVRCIHEARLHRSNAFVTLTYSPDHVPIDGSLRYSDFQDFMKRLRKWQMKGWRVPLKWQSPRFYMCGEYGENTLRPHYHACLFGVEFPDAKRFGGSSQYPIYTSKILSELWPLGHASFGEVTFESAAYVARYVMKKVTGKNAVEHYKRVDPETGEVFDVVPEFNKMSLKPGIGAEWFHRFKSDVVNTDKVTVRGVQSKPPRYYDKLLGSIDPGLFEQIQFERFKRNLQFTDDQTPDRLQTRELVTRARVKFKKRSYE